MQHAAEAPAVEQPADLDQRRLEARDQAPKLGHVREVERFHRAEPEPEIPDEQTFAIPRSGPGSIGEAQARIDLRNWVVAVCNDAASRDIAVAACNRSCAAPLVFSAMSLTRWMPCETASVAVAA